MSKFTAETIRQGPGIAANLRSLIDKTIAEDVVKGVVREIEEEYPIPSNLSIADKLERKKFNNHIKKTNSDLRSAQNETLTNFNMKIDSALLLRALGTNKSWMQQPEKVNDIYKALVKELDNVPAGDIIAAEDALSNFKEQGPLLKFLDKFLEKVQSNNELNPERKKPELAASWDRRDGETLRRALDKDKQEVRYALTHIVKDWTTLNPGTTPGMTYLMAELRSYAKADPNFASNEKANEKANFTRNKRQKKFHKKEGKAGANSKQSGDSSDRDGGAPVCDYCKALYSGTERKPSIWSHPTNKCWKKKKALEQGTNNNSKDEKKTGQPKQTNQANTQRAFLLDVSKYIQPNNVVTFASTTE
jgi:hypothetical protein